MNSKDNKTEQRIVELEKKVAALSAFSGGMLSSLDFRKYIIQENIPKIKEHFKRRNWDKLPNPKSFIIDPYDALKLTPFSYDLSIGNEAFSCRTEDFSAFKLSDDKEEAYFIQPGETAIVRTLEYIALPRCYSATVWPRFNFVREGIFQSMVKIDPTWYGQLGVALTNLSPAEYPIWKGVDFATLILFELKNNSDITLYLTGETLGEKVLINLNNLANLQELENNLSKAGLKDKVLIDFEQKKLIIEMALTHEEIISLRNLYDTKEWKSEVENKITFKTMDALGLQQLDLILSKNPQGKRLTKSDIPNAICERQDLIEAAMDKGKPFNLFSAIPDLILEEVESEITPRIRAEVEAAVFPKTVTLTLTVLGFLSLIVAVAAFVTSKFRPESESFMQIEWPTTISVITFSLVIILAISLSHLIFRKSKDSKAIKKLKKKLKQDSSSINALYKRLKKVEKQGR
jgi:deoxycytidine triphosphate deaminase